MRLLNWNDARSSSRLVKGFSSSLWGYIVCNKETSPISSALLRTSCTVAENSKRHAPSGALDSGIAEHLSLCSPNDGSGQGLRNNEALLRFQEGNILRRVLSNMAENASSVFGLRVCGPGVRWYGSSSSSEGAEGLAGSLAIDYSSLLSEKDFHKIADMTLDQLQERIEECGEDLEVDGFDTDHAEGVLTVRLGPMGTYVINKQTPNRQIWLSSPVSGPARFDWHQEEKTWVYRRTKAELFSLLEKELGELLKADISLSK